MLSPIAILIILISLLLPRLHGAVASTWHRRSLRDADQPLTPLRFNASAINSFVRSASECPAGCERLGNCNRELGECECPWPRLGGHLPGVGQLKSATGLAWMSTPLFLTQVLLVRRIPFPCATTAAPPPSPAAAYGHRKAVNATASAISKGSHQYFAKPTTKIAPSMYPKTSSSR